ncbi:MAG: cysteine desulfurase family protein, partial [Acidimicrobiales bacterium]
MTAGPGDPPVAYLDHAATSPVRPEVAEALQPFAAGLFGNASGSHRLARRAREALEDARDEVADVLGCAPAEVVFTSGGTEADNLAVQGVLRAAAGGGPAAATVVCSAVEHAAVLEPCRALARAAGRHAGPPVVLRETPVDGDGAVDPAGLAEVLDPGVVLVSVMLANNEVGTVQPMARVAEAVRRHAPSAVLHTDAVQAAPWADVGREAAGADLVSVSAHKLGGPKGAGALVVRAGTLLAPLLYGGGQEQERRSGTHDVAGAVGLAVALRAA